MKRENLFHLKLSWSESRNEQH